ncbi:MAG TPA: hypothetical protein VGT98_14705 [Candidatus Elarobacter sp.]|nr:hypothetical protein [Candidatus Elarobacter sp.]
MRIFRAGPALASGACAFVLSACGFSASPADGLRFAAPPGWRSSPGILGFMQFWRPPADDNQVLMLFKSPKPLKASDVFSYDRMQDTLKDARVTSRRSIAICGDQPATYIEARGSSAKGGNDKVDMVMTTLRETTYFALYVRPVEAVPDAQAEAALRELCAKP